MTLSKKQSLALEKIEQIEEHFRGRWFIQAELQTITLHTMKALVEKGFLEVQEFEGYPYYRYKRNVLSDVLEKEKVQSKQELQVIKGFSNQELYDEIERRKVELQSKIDANKSVEAKMQEGK